MKKICLILLCITVLCCAAAAAAEKESLGIIDMNGAFELKCALPDGYRATRGEMDAENNGNVLWLIVPDDNTRPTMVLSIAFDEMFSDVDRFNDVDADRRAAIEATFREEDEVEISYTQTALGTDMMVVKEVRDAVDFVDYYSIYKGYTVEFIITRGEGNQTSLTDDDIRMAEDFLSELDFVSVDAAPAP